MPKETHNKKTVWIFLGIFFVFILLLLVLVNVLSRGNIIAIRRGTVEEYWQQQSKQIEDHYQQWTTQEIKEYQIEIHWIGYPEDCNQEAIITIENHGLGKFVKNDCQYGGGGNTIESLFSTVRNMVDNRLCGANGCSCDGPFIMDVVYDEKYSFPKIATPSIHPEERWRFGTSPTFCTLKGYLQVGWEVDSFLPLK